jgi:Acetyltransferase (GNAT) domain
MMAGAASAAGDALRFTWAHSRRPRIGRCRTLVECDLVRHAPVWTSRPSTAAEPVFTYGGCAEGRVRVLDELERRAGAEPGAFTRTESTATWSRLLGGAVGADVLAVGCSSRQAAVVTPGPETFLLPYRLHFVVDLGAGCGPWWNRVSRRERRAFTRTLEAEQFELEISRRPADLEWFLAAMYQPTMAARHGEAARGMPWSVVRRQVFARGFVAFVRARGERVAGIVCRWEHGGRALTTRLIGVLGGDPELYSRGASKAAYMLLLGWAERRGVEAVDMMGTEAFVASGTFQWKRRLGARLAVAPNHSAGKRVVLRARYDRPAVRAFLVANPFLAFDGQGRLEVVRFRDGAGAAPPAGLSWHGTGVERVREVSLP